MQIQETNTKFNGVSALLNRYSLVKSTKFKKKYKCYSRKPDWQWVQKIRSISNIKCINIHEWN